MCRHVVCRYAHECLVVLAEEDSIGAENFQNVFSVGLSMKVTAKNPAMGEIRFLDLSLNVGFSDMWWMGSLRQKFQRSLFKLIQKRIASSCSDDPLLKTWHHVMEAS